MAIVIMYNRDTVFNKRQEPFIQHNLIIGHINMSNKFFLKKTWVNVDVCVEDYYNSGTTLQDLEKLKWSPYSNIINREVKETRHTVEEIDEETFKNKIKKSDSEKSTNKKVSFEDYKAE